MALQTSINLQNHLHDDDEDDLRQETNKYDEELDETEGELIENYLFLTQRCGALRHSPTTSALSTMQQQQNHQQINFNLLSRQMSLATDDHLHGYERALPPLKARSSLNDFNNFYQTDYLGSSRVPPNIYYNVHDGDDWNEKSFSLVKLFARMKQRLNHDRRYRPKSTHQLLHEEDSHEWLELTKNTRDILTKALLPDGGYDALVRHSRSSQSRRNSQKKRRDCTPVLAKELDDDQDKITFYIDDEVNTEGDETFDEIIRKNFLQCSRGANYRRAGICKAVDRQQFQGQLVFVYGVANNILIDENLKASGLG